MALANGSWHKTNKAEDNGHPCLTDLPTLNLLDSDPLTSTILSGLSYNIFIHLRKSGHTPILVLP
jgi:hypothetical protein